MEDKLVPPPLSCSLYQLLAGDGGLVMCAKNTKTETIAETIAQPVKPLCQASTKPADETYKQH